MAPTLMLSNICPPKTRQACGIPDVDQFIITGGFSKSVVTGNVHVYNTDGWVKDLPSLNIARSNHACASFMKNGERVSKKYHLT